MALTVATASTPPAIDYAVTIHKTDNPAQTIVVIDSSHAIKYSGSIKKNTPVVVNLPNGPYTIHLNSRPAPS